MDESMDEPLDPLGDALADPLSFVSLYEGAYKFAQSALEAHGTNDMEVFLLHAGVSIERLAKAALVHRSPFLLMELRGKDDTLYHLTGVRQTAKLRTIGASQAISRLRDMGVLPEKDSDLDELIELRNGVAHLMASIDDEFDGLKVFCQVTNQLLNHLGEETSDYWDAWSTYVGIALDDAQKKVERDVARRMERTRRKFHVRFEGLPKVALDSYVASLPRPVGLQASSGKVFVPWTCPACEHLALIVAGPTTFDSSGKPGMASPEWFTCFVCRFTLKQHEMRVEAARIPHEVPLVDENGERLMSDVEEYLWHFDPTGANEESRDEG